MSSARGNASTWGRVSAYRRIIQFLYQITVIVVFASAVWKCDSMSQKHLYEETPLHPGEHDVLVFRGFVVSQVLNGKQTLSCTVGDVIKLTALPSVDTMW